MAVSNPGPQGPGNPHQAAPKGATLARLSTHRHAARPLTGPEDPRGPLRSSQIFTPRAPDPRDPTSSSQSFTPGSPDPRSSQLFTARSPTPNRRSLRPLLAPVFSAILGLGCAIERGKGWDTPAPPVTPDAPRVSLVLLGEAGYPGRTAASTAAELARTLDDHRQRSIPTLVLWLGDAVGPNGLGCPTSADPWAQDGLAELAKVVRAHQSRGGPSYAVLGTHEYACDRPELALQPGPQGPHPWVLPAANYVLRVARDGAARVVSSCTGNLCTVEAPTPDTLVDLVVLDTTAWLAATPQAPTTTTSLTQQQALLANLELAPSDAPPRLLVTHHPVETAGPHGQGGLYPDSAYFLHAEPLRRAIDRGLFTGVLSGHDRSLSATADISNAVKRSSRFWLKHPVFQVVSGGAAHPDGAPSGGRRGWVYYQGQSLRPDLLSNRAGFAELVVTTTDFAARLHQRKHGRWRASEIHIPLRRPPHPAETPSPILDPCLACDPVPPRR